MRRNFAGYLLIFCACFVPLSQGEDLYYPSVLVLLQTTCTVYTVIENNTANVMVKSWLRVRTLYTLFSCALIEKVCCTSFQLFGPHVNPYEGLLNDKFWKVFQVFKVAFSDSIIMIALIHGACCGNGVSSGLKCTVTKCVGNTGC